MTIDPRREIERALKRELAEWEWSGLEAQGYVEDIELGVRTAGDVADTVRGPRHDRDRSSVTSRDHAPPTEWHRRRIKLLAKVYGAFADQEPSVANLRRALQPDWPLRQDLDQWILAHYREDLGVEEDDEVAEIQAIGRGQSEGKELISLWFADIERVHQKQVFKDTLLGAIARIADQLTSTYRWRNWDSTRWLLTAGDPPLPVIFRSWPQLLSVNETDTPSRLLLEVDPILQPSEVAALYATARNELVPGRRLRPLTDKALTLAEFAFRQSDDDWARGASHIRRKWNDAHGDACGFYQSTGGGPSNFNRDLRNSINRLITIGWQ